MCVCVWGGRGRGLVNMAMAGVVYQKNGRRENKCKHSIPLGILRLICEAGILILMNEICKFNFKMYNFIITIKDLIPA